MKTKILVLIVLGVFFFKTNVFLQPRTACAEFIYLLEQKAKQILQCNATQGFGSTLSKVKITAFEIIGNTIKIKGEYEATNPKIIFGQYYDGKFELIGKISSAGIVFSSGTWEMKAMNIDIWGSRTIITPCLTPLNLPQALLIKLKNGEIYSFQQWERTQQKTRELAYKSATKSDSAIYYGRRAMEMADCIYGMNSPEYFASTSLLAKIFNAKGQFETGINLMNRIIQECKKLPESGLPQYANYYLDLASAYANLGGYPQADEIFQQLIVFFDFQVRDQDFSFVLTLHACANAKMKIGHYGQAVTYLERAVKLIKTIHNPNADQLYSFEAKLDLANAYAGSSQPYKANALYLDLETHLGTISVPSNTVSGAKTTGLITSLNQLMNNRITNPGAASIESRILPNFKEETENFKRKLYADYSLFLRINGKTETALKYLQKAYDLDKKQTPTAFSSLSCELCTIYDSLRKETDAIPFVAECLNFQKQKRKEALALSGKRYGMYFASDQESDLNKLTTMAYRYRKLPFYNNIIFDIQLFSRNSLLQNERTLFNSIKASGKPDLLFKYQKLSDLRDSLYRSNANSTQQQSLKTEVNRLENEIAEQSMPFKQSSKDVNWIDVQKTLKPDEAVIQFIRVEANPAVADSSLYCAVLVRPGDPQARVIKLCYEKTLLRKLEEVKNNQESISGLYRGGKPLGAKDSTKIKATKFLYHTLWEPLEPYLKKDQTIFYSLDGLLHRIAFDAISNEKGEHLLNLYALRLVSSTKDLVWGLKDTHLNPGFRFYLAGGINYSQEAQSKENGQIFVSEFSSTYTNDQSIYNLPPRYLKGTLAEVNLIGEKLKTTEFKHTKHIENEANEEQVKSLENAPEGSPEVIHLATHGFYKNKVQGKGTGEALYYEEEAYDPVKSLLNSGLLLAGCEPAWLGKKNTQKEDGIFSALEISNLDFSNTQLVVLSACETGLGDLRGKEGTFGLERAFKLAGASKLIVSLWEVNDQATVPFMYKLYEKWIDDKTELYQAFRAAKKEIAAQHNADPFFWAPFILIE